MIINVVNISRGTISAFDLIKGEIVKVQRHLQSHILEMNVDSFGYNLVLARADESIGIYDLENLKRPQTLVKMVSIID